MNRGKEELMNKLIFILVLSLIILVLSGCRHDNAPVPLKFKGYEGNPILVPGEPGSWDDLLLIAPQVYWYDSLFYLFYTAGNTHSGGAIGLATSLDGIHYSKFEGNPVLAPDGSGYDAWQVSGSVLLKYDTIWHMYFNAAELIRYGCGQSIGHAVAASITGPWIKDEKPVLTTGSIREWDGGFMFPGSFIRLADGSYRIYYTGGGDFEGDFVSYTGMAFSMDGINWKKYNDPATPHHPFAESDPVLPTGDKKAWDSNGSWFPFVYEMNGGYNMFFTGLTFRNRYEESSIGFATSNDGIHWKEYPHNPVFSVKDDPFAATFGTDAIIGDSWLVFRDTICYMYYDYGVIVGKIGMAKAVLEQAADH